MALEDLREIVDYITITLKAPKAAKDLIDDIEDSILNLQHFPFSFKEYQPTRPLETKYRMLPVNNYIVFYVVTEQEVEIHRIVYAKMNLEKIIEK